MPNAKLLIIMPPASVRKDIQEIHNTNVLNYIVNLTANVHMTNSALMANALILA